MKIISIDLPWDSATKGRRVLAIADSNSRVVTEQAVDCNELIQLVQRNSESGSIILLDIPVEGCNKLGSEHFRPVDRALLKLGVPLFPSSRAENRGKLLQERLEKDRRVKVFEIYPYANYKFLAYLKDKELLYRLKLDRFDTLLAGDFKTYWPPKYKREANRLKRVKNMEYLYSLLVDKAIGLSFEKPLPRPESVPNLDKLGDEYDACLGVIVGLYLAKRNRYACLVGEPSTGSILMLIDQWLSEKLSKEVKLYRPQEE